MGTIVLDRLSLRDFKGMTFVLDVNGDDTDIYGANATGKTTLADAFSWLLFDKDSLGHADFEIKNLDAQGEAEHGLEHSVEAVLQVDDIPDINPSPITLKKVYKEIWTKKRGSAKATFTGHTTDYFIDSVPIQKKDYIVRVAEIAGDESIFRLLTSPSAFPALHWQKQRGLLLEICGDISDSDVIESDNKLAKLSEILGKRSIDDHRKVITAKKAEINKELEKIPVRISEQQRSLPDITGLKREVAEAEVKRIETLLNEAKLKLQGVDTGGKLADLTKKMAIINADLQKMENQHYTETMKKINQMTQRKTEITERIRADRNRITAMDNDIVQKKKIVDHTEKVLQGLREKWSEIDSQAFQDITADICAACGQALPADRVQEAREKALAAFNLKKAEDLAEIENKGKQAVEARDNLQAEIDSLLKESDNLSANIVLIESNLQEITAEYDSLKRTAEDYTLIPGHAELLTQKVDIENLIKSEKEGRSDESAIVRKEIFDLEHHLLAAKGDADKFTRREYGEKRIEELKAEEKVLAAEYERLEKELYLTEEFIRAKVTLLTDRINSRFEIARFKLFNTLVNQGIEECCEITVNGIPYYGGLNNAARINAGLDVCRTLSQHYGLQAPIFVDNAEAVCELMDMDAQVIRLVVSEKDIVLRVETARKAVMA